MLFRSQRCVGFAEQRRELVEQARSRADPLALHARAQLRHLQAVKLRAVATAQRGEGEAERDLERRRGGKTGAARKIAADLKPCSAGGKSGRAELGHHAAHERPPAARRRAIAQPEAVVLAEVCSVPCGGSLLGANIASAEPPKPPPIMRAPAAPASSSSRTVRSIAAVETS